MTKGVSILCVILISFNSAISQNSSWLFPYDYSSFTKKANIRWALEIFNDYAFSGDSAKQINIHSYLVSGQKRGLLKCYATEVYGKEMLEKWGKRKNGNYFTEIDHEFNNQFEAFRDSLNLTRVHEIFYLENHVLKSQVIVAAPVYEVVSSNGVSIGSFPLSYSSLNFFPTKQSKVDDIYFLGHTNSILNIDSLEKISCLKKTYMMPLSFALWYDLSKGFNKVTDLKTKYSIPTTEIMEYSPFDSIQVFVCIDSIVPLLEMVAAAPAYSYFSDVEIEQYWYYNKSRDIFFNRLDKAYLYIKYYDQEKMLYKNERRFEIIFKK